MTTEHDKGTIKESAVKALVRSNIFLPKQEKPKKGKGSYKRKKIFDPEDRERC